MKNIAIIGSGTWGVALSIHLANMGHNVKVWSFSQEEADSINIERKCKFLPNAVINKNIVCYTDMKTVIEGSDIILHVTPSKFVRNTIKQYKEYVTNQPIIMCAKGFEEKTLCTLSQIIEQEMPNAKYGIFSGPSHAEEVSLGIPTAIVIASHSKEVQDLVQETFMNEKMRVYTSNDVIGVELGGALKNIIAFCAGIATEINLGDNSFAALISRGLVEITRLGTAMGGNHDTFYGLSGLGDLIVTCMSEHSRNRRAGRLIGKGYTVEQAKQEIGMVIESIDNIDVAYALAKKYNIEMPIVNAVYDVLYNNLNPKDAVTMLMTREKKSE
ncbi:MAG: NAD(P)H-dependent glycerol-3-phosphate dehydrogenase [Clostridia bacterium]